VLGAKGRPERLRSGVLSLPRSLECVQQCTAQREVNT
jgi:hypothetical protein